MSCSPPPIRIWVDTELRSSRPGLNSSATHSTIILTYRKSHRNRRMHIPVVILGAGIAGISAATAIQHIYPKDYLVLESSGGVGGMSASFRIHDFQFDYGIHGLYTEDHSIFQMLANAISNDHDSL